MFVRSRTGRRSGNPLGKMERVPVVGVQQFSDQAYRGFRFQIGRRTLGVTVKRATYSVAIRQADGPDSGYLTDLPSLEAAHAAARAWIDERHKAAGTSARKPWPPLLTQARARQQRPATSSSLPQGD